MAKHLKLFETHAQYAAFTQTEDFVLPNVSHCIEEQDVHYNPVPHNYANDYCTFVAHYDNTDVVCEVNGTAVNLSYSLDNGASWVNVNTPQGFDSIVFATINAGDKILLKGNNVSFSDSEGEYVSHIFCSNNFNVEGNILSLAFGDNFRNPDWSLIERTIFGGFFRKNYMVDPIFLISAENLVLPETPIDYCYATLFMDCQDMTTPPKILPATILSSGCYSGMFRGCVSLTTAPELPATTLASSCYNGMFQGCTSLNYIKAMFTTEPTTSYTNNWVNGVSGSGTFVKNSAAQWDVTGNYGVPSGWTVETASE